MKQIGCVALFAALLGCSEMIPGTCYLNPAGGVGGGGPIPTTSVGATSGTGDFLATPSDPQNEPLTAGDDGDGNGDTYEFCVQDNPCVECQASGVNGYSPSIFRFVTIIPDDGTASGWQEASANLNIVRWLDLIPEYWSCPVRVGMPMRTTLHGPISAEYAAIISAQVATEATRNVKNSWAKAPQGVFCSKVKPEMQRLFNRDYKSIGAQMM